MKNKNDIQELIRGVRNKQADKEDAFYKYANKIIYNVSQPILKKLQTDMAQGNIQSIGREYLPEDVCNDIFLLILQQIKREPYVKIEHPAGYIRKVTENYCRRLRSQRKSLALRDHIQKFADGIIDDIEDTAALEENKKKETKKDTKKDTKKETINRYYNRSFSYDIRKGIDNTVSYLSFFYEAKKRLAESRSRDDKPFLIYERLRRLEKDIKKITRKQTPREEEIQRYLYLQHAPLEIGTPESDKKTDKHMQELRSFQEKYGYTLSQVCLHLYKIKRRLESEMMFNDPVFLSIWTGPGETEPGKIKFWSDFIYYMPKMKADPSNLLFLIWQKIDVLRKGTRRNHKKINLIFTYQKLKTAGTEKAFLFDSINPGIRRKTAATKRKAAYKEKLKAKHYQDLINFIYEKSFASIRK